MIRNDRCVEEKWKRAATEENNSLSCPLRKKNEGIMKIWNRKSGKMYIGDLVVFINVE